MKSNFFTNSELDRSATPEHRNGLIVVGAVGERPLPSEAIDELLSQQRQELGREGDFIGKSTTCMFVDKEHVLKLLQRTAFDDSRVALRWVELRLRKERGMGLYHPSRTWFIVRIDGRWFTGNITQRLRTFHAMFENPSIDPDEAIAWITQVCHKYLAYAAHHDGRLDEGLSNFGLDGEELYYLDDDLFEWDHFHAFSALLAGWFRRYSRTWMHAKAAARLGAEVGRILRQHFDPTNGIDTPQVISEQIKGMFFPAGTIQEAADAFRQALLEDEHGTVERFHTLDQLAQCLEEEEPIALLADIHANLPALEAVLRRVRELGVKRMIILGDIVGYGPHPAACVELLQELGALSIRGNHDHAIGNRLPLRSMSVSSTWVAEWTQDHIDDRHRRYLAELPTRLLHLPWIAVHGAPADPTFFNAYIYDRTAEHNLLWMMNNHNMFCIHGHCHLQAVYSMHWGSMMHKFCEQEVDLSESATAHLICPGSVGQPRGGDPRAAFSVLYPTQRRLVNYREEYPVRHTIGDMLAHGFPEQLIQRLKEGN